MKIYLFTVGLFIFSGCGEDFLDRQPVTSLTQETFYKTSDDAFEALVGCYDGLQRVWEGGIALPVAAEVFSDNAFGGTGNSDGFGYQMMDEFDKNRSTADQNLFQTNWIAYYKAVYRANVLLTKMDEIDWGNDEELRPVYEAEARFIRAYVYFDMVRLWGNIPLVTEPTSENVPQADPAEVYRLIASDLQFAAENLPHVSYAEQPPSTYGRVTKWAAEALLARVFLYYTGYYGETDLVGMVSKADALGYVEDVIASSGHSLVANFASLWPAASLDGYAGENNPETVFAIKYTYTSDYNGNSDGNHWMVMFGIREQASYPYGNGWGGATVNPKLWNAYDDADTRRAATIIAIEEEEIPFENESRQREYTGYYNKKYAPMVDEDGNSVAVENGGANFMIGQLQDYVSIRYADVLLMAAELGSPNAQAYFDQVRKRAFKESFTAIPVTGENIMEERRLEFALEGIRYWDLLRSGINEAAATIAEATQLLNGGVPTAKVIEVSNIIETKGLQQIPNTQVTLSNGTLQQNPGW